MESCVSPVKRERVPGSGSQLNGGSDDVSNCFPDLGVADRGRL